jgi:hypothetical protein
MKPCIYKSWLIIILIVFLSINGAAKKSDADSLRLKIALETNDTVRIKLLIRLGLNYAENDSLANGYLKEAYDLSVKKRYRYGLAFGQYYKVLELTEKGSYDEAINQCKRCIDAIDSMDLIVGSPLVNIRFWFIAAGKQEERFRYYSEKASYYKRHGSLENLSDCYHGIAGYYWYLANYDKAIEYYLLSRECHKSLDSTAYYAETTVIGSMYMEWGNLDKAEECLNAGISGLTRMKTNMNSFYSYHKLGEVYLKRHNYKKALRYFLESRKYIVATVERAVTLLCCAEAHLDMNSKDSAWYYIVEAEKIRQKEKFGIATNQGNFEMDYTLYKYYSATRNDKLAGICLEKALNEANEENHFALSLKYTNELHSFLLKKGDSLQAFRLLIKYNTLRDSVNALSNQARIATFEIEQQQRLKEDEIEQLKIQKTAQGNYYLFGGIVFILIVFFAISRILYKRKRDNEQLQTEFKKQLAQAETKALRAQMNPHFIFNSLNSINSFVIDQKHELASDYLIKFSKLIRLILDNSRSETISIEKELETLKLYVILESARFDNKFKCVYKIADNINTNSIMIPPMLLQPFVENAIWHGLMQKEGEGTITIEIRKEDEEFLNISIADDGIGREKAAELKSKSATHKSHGLKVTSQRIEMMNKLNSTGAQVHIFDLKDEQGITTGTKVELIIPY